MVQHIGIVGCSAEGAALCYRTVCLEGEQLLGAYQHPEVSVHTHALGEYMRHVSRDDWAGVAELMLSSAHKLAGAGADFLICPDNTIHRALPAVLARSPRPWLHIAEVVAGVAAARGYRTLGITGTRYLVESEVYPQKLSARGLAYLRPDDAECAEVNRIIFEELVRGVCSAAAVTYLRGVFTRLQAAGADAIVLGCTELPLIMSDANSPLPTLDSTRLLARAALARAAGKPEVASGGRRGAS
jgi:aspartate racemase